jgi:hypothetical protein
LKTKTEGKNKMCWKKMPGWLKGGVLLDILYIIITLILIPFGSTPGGFTTPYWIFPSSMGTPIIVLLSGGSIIGGTFLYKWLIPLTILFALIIYFLIGSIIGFIISKIKSSKNKK